MTDYVMPVEYKYVDNIDSDIISICNNDNIGNDILNDLRYWFSGQRFLESKILIKNELQYMRNLNEAQVNNILHDFKVKDKNEFLCNTCILKIKHLFDVSEGNFFAMQTAKDTFNNYTFSPRLTSYALADNLGRLNSSRPDKDAVLAVLVPACSSNSINYSNSYKKKDSKCFYGDFAFLELSDGFSDILNNYFI